MESRTSMMVHRAPDVKNTARHNCNRYPQSRNQLESTIRILYIYSALIGPSNSSTRELVVITTNWTISFPDSTNLTLNIYRLLTKLKKSPSKQEP